MMYDELVKRLKDDEAWKNCDFDFIYDWMHEAADVIEELLSERDEVNADSWKTAFEVERDEHRWIPVTERLPEKSGNYLVVINCPRGRWDEICAFDGEKEWVSIDEYAEFATKWVTHWMPLPEPPREGKA